MRRSSAERERVTVLGAGVVGLTCAVALGEAGFDVEVVAREEPLVSAVAGGLWQPYATGEDPRTLGWARETYDWLALLGHPVVDLVELTDVRPAWIDACPPGSARPARDEELPAGRGPGWVVRVPLVETERHLAALHARLERPVRHAEVGSLAELLAPPDGASLAVNCTGLAAGALTGDPALFPIRGQVVHVRPDPAAGRIPCVVDDRDLTYVLPRPDLCVLGGTSQAGDGERAPRDEETADILARCTRLVPALARATVLRTRVGLRPGRHGGARVEREGRVIHCYGHGGAGLTLSWGCAREVVRLAGGDPPATA